MVLLDYRVPHTGPPASLHWYDRRHELILDAANVMPHFLDACRRLARPCYSARGSGCRPATSPACGLVRTSPTTALTLCLRRSSCSTSKAAASWDPEPSGQELSPGELVQQFQGKPGRMKLGSLGFRTKKQAQQFVSQWWQASRAGAVVSGQDLSWVMAVLTRHPNYKSKTAGLAVAKVLVDRWQGHNCFWLCRSDGSRIDISHRKCWTYTQASEVLHVLRQLVNPQVQQVRARVFQGGRTVLCPESGVVLRDDPDTHIDHHFNVLPYKDLVAGFCQEYSYKLDQLELAGWDKIQAGSSLADPLASQRFLAYHQTHARLRAVSKAVNLRGLVGKHT